MKPETSRFRLSTAEVEHFWTRGYLGPYTLLPPAAMQPVLEAIDATVAAGPGPCLKDETGQPDPLFARHEDSPELLGLATHPGILHRVQSLLGEAVGLFLSRLWVKDPGSAELPWHQDATYWPIYPKVAVTAWLALSRADRDNGCVNLIPGSHLEICPEIESPPEMGFPTMVDPEFIAGSETVTMEVDAGQFFFFDANLLHQSDANPSTRRRVGLQLSFMPPLVRLEKDWFFAGHRVLMLGGDDPFGLNQVYRL